MEAWTSRDGTICGPATLMDKENLIYLVLLYKEGANNLVQIPLYSMKEDGMELVGCWGIKFYLS